MNKNLRDIVISTLALAVIGGGVTAALAGTNALTADRIATINEQTATAARQAVIDADSFEEASVTMDGKEVRYHRALKNGDLVGYVFTAAVSGKSSGLVVMTGIAADGTVTGVEVTEENETAGYVDKVRKAGLFGAFTGKSSTDGVDTVSQATKTSKGILHGVELALSYYQTIGKEGET